MRAWRLGATLLTAVGVLALLIAAAGLNSMLTFDLAQRRRELGIRAALGASAVRLIGDAVRASFAAVAAGVLLGLGASFLGGRGVESLLFQVRAHDLAVYTGACVTLLAVGLLATVLPARGVTRTDPAMVLREE
jgi:ABC-type antimicrobial peptide transport system permease subunit